MKSDASNQLTSAALTPGSPPQLLSDLLIGTQTGSRMLMMCTTRVLELNSFLTFTCYTQASSVFYVVTHRTEPSRLKSTMKLLKLWNSLHEEMLLTNSPSRSWAQACMQSDKLFFCSHYSVAELLICLLVPEYCRTDLNELWAFHGLFPQAQELLVKLRTTNKLLYSLRFVLYYY